MTFFFFCAYFSQFLKPWVWNIFNLSTLSSICFFSLCPGHSVCPGLSGSERDIWQGDQIIVAQAALMRSPRQWRPRRPLPLNPPIHLSSVSSTAATPTRALAPALGPHQPPMGSQAGDPRPIRRQQTSKLMVTCVDDVSVRVSPQCTFAEGRVVFWSGLKLVNGSVARRGFEIISLSPGTAPARRAGTAL